MTLVMMAMENERLICENDDSPKWQVRAYSAGTLWSGEGHWEEIGLQTCSGDWQRGCRGEVLSQTVVPGASCSNRKCPVTDDGKARTISDDDATDRRRRRASEFTVRWSSSAR